MPWEGTLFAALGEEKEARKEKEDGKRLIHYKRKVPSQCMGCDLDITASLDYCDYCTPPRSCLPPESYLVLFLTQGYHFILR